MRSIVTALLKRLLSGKVLAMLLIPGALFAFAGAGFALNAIFNPPEPMTGREMIEKYMIDGFQRKSGGRGGTSPGRVYLQVMNSRAMIRLSGYARDEAAVNRHPRLAYRQHSRLPSGPMPLLQDRGGMDLHEALDMASAIPTPGEPPLRVAVISQQTGASINEINRIGSSRTDSGGDARIGFRPHEDGGEGDGPGPQIGFRPHEEDPGENGEENNSPSPVPLPAPFWMLLPAILAIVGLRRKQAV